MKVFKNHEAHFDLCNSYEINCVIEYLKKISDMLLIYWIKYHKLHFSNQSLVHWTRLTRLLAIIWISIVAIFCIKLCHIVAQIYIAIFIATLWHIVAQILLVILRSSVLTTLVLLSINARNAPPIMPSRVVGHYISLMSSLILGDL